MAVMREIEVKLNTADLEKQLVHIRLCLSQIGWALDNLLLSLSENREASE